MKKHYKIVSFFFMFLVWSVQGFAQAFITTWVTNNNQITIPTTGTGYNYNLTWTNLTNTGVGDGSATNVTTLNYTITGLENGSTYQISITGSFPRIIFGFGGESSKLRRIAQWGNIAWSSMSYAFAGCNNMTYTATDTPNLTGVVDMSYMFSGCSLFNGNIGGWNTNTIVNMSGLFSGATAFNQTIGNWNTSAVTNMNSMFSGASAFNDGSFSSIGGWNVSNVTDMSGMFYQASAFNRNIGSWNVTNVLDMSFMFFQATTFNRNIGSWQLSNANLSNMLNSCGMSITNYENTLAGWAGQNITNRNLGATGMRYCTSTNRNTLTLSKGWTITGDNNVCTDAFVTTWITTTNNITIPTTGTGYNYNLTWTNLTNGDANDGNVGNLMGNYNILGLTNTHTYRIIITGNFPRIFFNGGTECPKIRTIAQWGNIAWTSMQNAFYGCTNLTYTATDAPNFSVPINASNMFRDCTNFNGNIGNWNTSNIVFMSGMFQNATNFNGNISSWNVSNVTNMQSIFQLAMAFNQNIGGWNVSNVTNMQSMFHDARSFNQNIGGWNVSNVTNMQSMFQGTNSFNQDLSNWNTANVTNMINMFYGNLGFNGNITTWNTSNVTNMSAMFLGTTLFNQNISGWNTSNVTNMAGMFNATNSFNQNIGGWNTSNVTDMGTMFGNSLVFNQDISTWNTGNVLNMGGMFQLAQAFNQNISTWNTSKVTAMTFMFSGAKKFNQNLGAWDVSKVTDMTNMLANTNMSVVNYDNTLIGWASQILKPNVTLTSTGIRYCNGQTARNTLTSAPNNWVISGDIYLCGADVLVWGNNVVIAHNDLVPSLNDNTDFGNFQNNANFTRTFTITNRGFAPLSVPSITSSNTTNFIVNNISLTADFTGVSFDVTFNANTTGIKTSNIIVSNNDPLKSTYTFAVKGTIVQANEDNKRGNALTFDGTQNLICTGFSTLENYTIEAWVKPNSTINQNILVGTNNLGAMTFVSHQLRIVNGKFSHYTFNGSNIIVTSNDPIVVNRWYHLAASVESNGQVKLYVDGVLQNIGRNTGTIWNGLTRFDIGAGSNSVDVGTLFNFTGTIDEVRIWSVGRTQTQIRENMHLTLPSNTTGLLAYYQFNETTGNVIDVVNNFNGVIGGIVRNTSSVSVGKGASKTITLPATGTTGAEIDINTTGFEMDFATGGTAPNGDVVVYQIWSETPFNNLSSATTSCYWLVRNFGLNQTGLSITSTRFKIPNSNIISNTDETTPNNIKLYKRADNSGDASWGGTFVSSGISANNSTKIITFGGGFSSFSEFIISTTGTSALPITLLDFTGKREDKDNILLNWKTATETNNKGFEIESSENGVSFTKIAFVDGAGNSNTIKNYELEIKNTDDSYYRLKQIDLNRDFSYSNIIFIKGIEQEIKVFPNPTTEKLILECKDFKNQSYFELNDIQHKNILKGNVNAEKIELFVGELPKGMYILNIWHNEKKISQKIIIQ